MERWHGDVITEALDGFDDISSPPTCASRAINVGTVHRTGYTFTHTSSSAIRNRNLSAERDVLLTISTRSKRKH